MSSLTQPNDDPRNNPTSPHASVSRSRILNRWDALLTLRLLFEDDHDRAWSTELASYLNTIAKKNHLICRGLSRANIERLCKDPDSIQSKHFAVIVRALNDRLQTHFTYTLDCIHGDLTGHCISAITDYTRRLTAAKADRFLAFGGDGKHTLRLFDAFHGAWHLFHPSIRSRAAGELMFRCCIIIFDKIDLDVDNRRIFVHFIGTSTYWKGQCTWRPNFLYFTFDIANEFGSTGESTTRRDDEISFLVLRDPERYERRTPIHGIIMALAQQEKRLRPIVAVKAMAVHMHRVSREIGYNAELRQIVDDNVINSTGSLEHDCIVRLHDEYCGIKSVDEINVMLEEGESEPVKWSVDGAKIRNNLHDLAKDLDDTKEGSIIRNLL